MFLRLIAGKRCISRVLLLGGLLCAFSVSAHAQADTGLNYLRGYVFVAPGWETLVQQRQSGYAVGGGVEQLLGKYVGAGVDLNGVIPGKQAASSTVGIASFNVYGHYKPKAEPDWDLFGSAGYALLFRDFSSNGYEFGGGANYWVHENLGLTWEVREEAVVHPPAGVAIRYVEFRIGLTFR